MVRARRHASGSAETSRDGLPNDAARMGLLIFQARRQLLGRAAWRSFSRSARNSYRSLSARDAGGSTRRRRWIYTRLQPPDLAFARPHPRVAQFERYQTIVGPYRQYG